MSGQAEPSSSSNYTSTATAGSKLYDVFLSFRGRDTRKNFTGHLRDALDKEGINVFLDSKKLRDGEEIGPALFNAIRGSKAYIVVFSEHYAESKWCLKELVEIWKCYESDPFILPIFLHDSPSEVEHQRGSFEIEFVKHENKYGVDAVKPWREALGKVANLKGRVIKEEFDGDESKLVAHAVEWALEVTKCIILSDVKPDIGILQYHANELIPLLDFGSKEVQFIGICGIAGIGKTAVAKTLHNLVVKRFRRSCFLRNISKEASEPDGLVSLQKELIHRISRRKAPDEISSVESGKEYIKQKLQLENNVLLILDDVDDLSQLDALAIDRNWFPQEWRVIITTRYENILYGFDIGKEKIYWPKALDDEQSLQLFSLHVFGQDEPFEEYKELSRVVASLSRGFPWVLKVLGDKLSGVRDIEVWKCRIRKWKECALPNEAYKRLNISYKKLEGDEVSVFLDAGCFFTGWEKETVISIWNACGFYPRAAIESLNKWSLLNFEVNEDGGYYLRMHDHVRDMARQIVLSEDIRQPGQRSRLWFNGEILEVPEENRVGPDEILGVSEGDRKRHDEILDVLEGNMGTDTIQGIFHPSDLQGDDLDYDCFQKMHNLRLLNINAKSFIGDFSSLPYALKWSQLKESPLEISSTNFYHKGIVQLHLSCSRMKRVWNTRPQDEKRKFKKLEVLSLRGCSDLSESPNFSWFPYLKQLDLRNCTSLDELDESIGQLTHLKNLILDCCKSLKKFPTSVGNLKDLERLDAIECYNLTHTPRSIQGQGTLSVECSQEYSYSLTVNDGICGKVSFLCIVLEFEADFMDELELEQQGPKTISLDVSATIRQRGKTVNCCHTLRIKVVEFTNHRDIIYIHPFEGFEWFGIPLEGKDAIEISFKPKSRVKFWKLLFERPDQKMPNVADFFKFLNVYKRKRCSLSARV